MDKNMFSKRLRELMFETKTNQRTLANELGITRQAISAYCTGRTTPDIFVFYKIADYFKVNADYLIGKVDRLDTVPIESLTKERNLLKLEIQRLRKAIQSINEILDAF